MSRLNNIVLSYLIADGYARTMKRPIVSFILKKLIMRKTGVTEDTAKKYINELESGIDIEGKVYKINYFNGGYVPWTTPKKSV